MDNEFNYTLIRSTNLLERVLDEEIPIFFSYVMKKSDNLMDEYRLNYDIRGLLNYCFKNIEAKFLDLYDMFIKDYINKLESTENKTQLLSDFEDIYKSFAKESLNKLFSNAFDDFSVELNNMCRSDNEANYMFKQQLLKSMEPELDNTIGEVVNITNKRLCMHVDDYLEDIKKENKKEDLPLNQDLEEAKQYLSVASDEFKENYEACMNILRNSIDDPLAEKTLNGYLNRIKQELELLKQGYTKDDFEETFDGLVLKEQEEKNIRAI